jgi:hypothetical protein
VNTISAEPPSALPTLADIQRRRAELLAWQGRPQPAQTTHPDPAVPPASPVPPMGPLRKNSVLYQGTTLVVP